MQASHVVLNPEAGWLLYPWQAVKRRAGRVCLQDQRGVHASQWCVWGGGACTSVEYGGGGMHISGALGGGAWTPVCGCGCVLIPYGGDV